MKIEIQQSSQMLKISTKPPLLEKVSIIGVLFLFGSTLVAFCVWQYLCLFGVFPSSSGQAFFTFAFATPFGLLGVFLLWLFFRAFGRLGFDYLFDKETDLFTKQAGNKVDYRAELLRITKLKKVFIGEDYRRGDLYAIFLDIENEDQFQFLHDIDTKKAHSISEAISQFLSIPSEDLQPVEA